MWDHGWLTRWRKWSACDIGEATEGLETELWRRWSDGRGLGGGSAHSPTLPSLHLCDSSFSSLAKPSVVSPTSQVIIQPFRRFTYVTAHSPHYPNLPSLHLRHSSLSNPSVASHTSQRVLQPFCRITYVTCASTYVTWRANHEPDPPPQNQILDTSLMISGDEWGPNFSRQLLLQLRKTPEKPLPEKLGLVRHNDVTLGPQWWTLEFIFVCPFLLHGSFHNNFFNSISVPRLCYFYIKYVSLELHVSPVESAAPGGCGDSNRFRPKARVPGLVGHLPRVSYVCLIGQSLRGRWWGWRRNGGDTGGSATDFLAFALRLRKIPENLS